MPEADHPTPAGDPSPRDPSPREPALGRLARLRDAFPAAERWIYFNHAAVCPLAEPVRAAVEEQLDHVQAHGAARFQEWLDRREEARGRAATLLGCEPGEVAFTTSTSEGLIHVAEGLPWEPGDEIVVLEGDFPANHVPWYHQERRGARVVVVPREEGGVTAAQILRHVTDRTRVVAVPTVLYDRGDRIDVAALGAALADHRARLCVDAIQSLGAFPLDVRAAGVDFLSADSHKWMLGLEGVGLFYCRTDRRDELDTPLRSWLSLADPFATYARGAPPAEDARRFEYACRPTAGIYGVDACLALLLETGVEAIAERVLELTDRLAAGLTERGWSVLSPRGERAACSGIVQAVAPGMAAADAVAALDERGVCVAERAGTVRFSPHGWNTPEEVDAALQRLPAGDGSVPT